MGPEAKIEAAFVRYAKSKRCLCYKFTSPSRRSAPDRIVVTPSGVTGYLELKAPGKKPSKAQAFQIRKLQQNGAPCSYADTLDKAKFWLDQLLELPGPGADVL